MVHNNYDNIVRYYVHFNVVGETKYDIASFESYELFHMNSKKA